ncbi:MAG: leucine--tRNA ligase [Acidobacteria bacterium]|nr:leucine--tRNA ligase [Acidobacteriota bacterium]
MPEPYDPQKIEPIWQEYWARERFAAADTTAEKDLYMLMMFPYPSGDLHVGHGRNYILGDCLFRMFLMQGRRVLNPMGWDAFGLPAENAAIKRSIHPREWTLSNIERMKRQFRVWGILYDWDKEIASCEPTYYRWNQWLFVRMLERGLAYRGKSPVNWCSSCKTVLANEQVVNGGCERCGTTVVQRDLEQWFLRITAYADRLLEGLDRLEDWSEKVKVMQRNWIGRSEGAEFTMRVEGRDDVEGFSVFTTRPDTAFGMTFAVLAPEHPLVGAVTTPDRRAEVESFVERVRHQTEIDRLSTEGEVSKRGVFTGSYAVNPFTGRPVPIYLADYVLMSYGTGAIMAVPGQDQRDWDFATAYGLPIVRTVQPPEGWEGQAYVGDGPAINSDWLNGMHKAEAIARATAWLEEQGIGKGKVNFRLRDWLISRQRYWGTPIPVVYCDRDGIVPVPDDQLPVVLPTDISFGAVEGNPLAHSPSFLAATCPKCGGPARRETDTMDTFMDSSWYYLRFVNPHVHDRMFDVDRVSDWMPVDLYIGGIEHAILHLLYARFINKVLHDFGMVPDDEPFTVLFNQGMITAKSATSGKLEKMSKSKGNVVAPDALIARYGADTERVYTLFMGPPEKECEWTDDGVAGAHRFLQRVWAHQDVVAAAAGREGDAGADARLHVKTHEVTKRVHDDLGRYHPNTASAAMMELSNAIGEAAERASEGALRTAYDTLLRLLHPIAPHITEELWRALGHDGSLLRAGWPTFDGELLARQQVTLAVQVNGKLRTTIQTAPGLDAEAAGALAHEAAAKWLDGKEIVKVVHVPDRLVSFVVRG